MKVLCILFFSFCLTAFSRVGENLNECERRYGPSIGKLKEQVQFRKNGIDVFISFHDGKASCIRCSGEITYVMAEELLKANGGGKKWIISLDDKAAKIWKTEDKELEATFVCATKDDVAHFIVLSRSLVNAAREVEKKAERKKIEGF